MRRGGGVLASDEGILRGSGGACRTGSGRRGDGGDGGAEAAMFDRVRHSEAGTYLKMPSSELIGPVQVFPIGNG